MGTGKRLKDFNKDISIVAVEPDNPMHGLEGLKHMASSIVPGIYHEGPLDGKIPAPTEESYDMVKMLAREEGLLVGQSSGAAMWGALKLGKTLKQGVIVTIFPDGGDKMYLSTRLWGGEYGRKKSTYWQKYWTTQARLPARKCCGILLGKMTSPKRIMGRRKGAENTNKERAVDRYEMNPDELLKIEREARQAGLEVVGVYHSHPDHPSRASEFDTSKGLA